MPWLNYQHDGAGGFANGHRRRHQTGHGIPCAVSGCGVVISPFKMAKDGDFK